MNFPLKNHFLATNGGGSHERYLNRLILVFVETSADLYNFHCHAGVWNVVSLEVECSGWIYQLAPPYSSELFSENSHLFGVSGHSISLIFFIWDFFSRLFA